MKISFAGDTSFTGIFRKKVMDGEEIFSEEFLSKYNKSEFFVLNFEGAATKSCQNENSKFALFSPTCSISYLNKYLNPIFNLANNHIFDCGLKGFLETKQEIKWQKLLYFGAGENIKEASRVLFLEHKNIRIAILGISHREGEIASKNSAGVFCQNEFQLLKQKIALAKKQANYVIVNYHGGEEYTFFPSPAKRKYLRKIAKLDGVDIIIAHHSHTFQGIEKIKNTTIFYSLGNFIFDIPQHKIRTGTNKSAIVSLTFTNENYEYVVQPIHINSTTGTINMGEIVSYENILKISDFSNYKNEWNSEAHRVLFKTDTKSLNMPEEKNSLKKMSILKLLFSKEFYERTFQILKNNNERDIYFGAIKHLIFNKFHSK
ncbi:MAG: CapA family protein [Bacteroidetes bacterium]|nr:CapA family protein [Bacteroidota bacterium]MBT6684703.1 CapA family protein [Bacteroidota bacterium]MBT7143172.1 CapA family protein [Bacteroidota bacterium]MBT7492615.1 CapA family protein [Bacteroidota bacterium]